MELRGRYPRQYSDIIKFFADWASNFGIDPNALYRLHLAGKLLLIFEGFDEMDLVGDYSIRLDHFRKIWEFSYPNSKIVITGRPNYFLNDTELKTILKTTETHTSHPHCEEIYIRMFDEGQIANSLRNADAETRDDILEILGSERNKSFIDLISRPALLFLTMIAWKERNLNKFKKNINSAIVLGEFLKQTYERQEVKGIKTPLSSIERSYFMIGCAIGMFQRNQYANQIDSTNLLKIIDVLYRDFPNDLRKNDISSNPSIKIKLSERFEEKYNQESVFLDIRSCGVLVRDLSTFDNYKFAHKSFLEYLISFYYANILIDFKEDENDKIMIRTIRNSLDASIDSFKKTPEVFRFIIQIISKRINTHEVKDDKGKMNKIFNTVYPVKWIGYKWALLLIPLCGRNLSLAFRRFNVSIALTLFFLLILFIGQGFDLPRFKEMFLWEKTGLIFGLFFILFYCMPIYIDGKEQNKIHKKRFSKFSFLDSFLNKLISDPKNQVLDIGNLNLWYQVCVETGVSINTIEEEIPKSMFEEFQKNHKAGI